MDYVNLKVMRVFLNVITPLIGYDQYGIGHIRWQYISIY